MWQSLISAKGVRIDVARPTVRGKRLSVNLQLVKKVGPTFYLQCVRYCHRGEPPHDNVYCPILTLSHFFVSVFCPNVPIDSNFQPPNLHSRPLPTAVQPPAVIS